MDQQEDNAEMVECQLSTSNVFCNSTDAINHIRFLHEPVDYFMVTVKEGILKKYVDGKPHNYIGYWKGSEAEECIHYLNENIISHDLIWLSLNRIANTAKAKKYSGKLATALSGGVNCLNDDDISFYNAVFIDVDTKKDKDRPATKEERNTAQRKASLIAGYLYDNGFQESAIFSSGNGYQLLNKVNIPVSSKNKLKVVLQMLGEKFDDDQTGIDTSVFNPARNIKLSGTYWRKYADYKSDKYYPSSIYHSPEEIKLTDESVLDKLINGYTLKGIFPLKVENSCDSISAGRERGKPATFKEASKTLSDDDFEHVCPVSLDERKRRASSYLESCSPAVSGKKGHPHTLRTVVHVVRGFCLEPDDAFTVLQDWNASCLPPWSDVELKHKINEAYEKGDMPFHCHLKESEGLPSSSNKKYEGDAVLVTLSDVVPEKVSWLWKDRIPFGKLTLLEGDPGLGKSILSLNIASAVSTGGTLPNGDRIDASDVVILSGEDGIADTIRPRVDAAMGNVNRIHILKAVNTAEGDTYVDLSVHIEQIKSVVKHRSARLIIIDPLMAYLGGKNSYKDQDIRRVLTPLAQMAEETSCAVLVIRHLTKSIGGPALYRGGGSIGIAGAARVVMLVTPNPDKPDEKGSLILSTVKNNLAKHADALGYDLRPVGDSVRCEWSNDKIRYTADQLLNVKPVSAKESAEEFLEKLLSKGSMPSKDIEQAAKTAGLSMMTVRRAKEALGIEVKKMGKASWCWRLPDDQVNIDSVNLSMEGEQLDPF